MPRVSVVLPFRDAADTLDDALRSIAAQTLPDFECLLIDNGSLDASAGVARAAAARDARFRYVRVDGGLVRALNAGVSAAASGLIARMDGDDLAHPTRLERQLRALDDDPTLAVSSCLVRCFSDQELQGGMRRYEAWLNALRTPDEIRDALFIESPIAHPSAVIRRAALEAVGGYRETGGPEDYDLWLRLLLGGCRAGKVAEVLLQWRDSTRRLSRSDARCHRRRFFATKVEHFPSAVPRGTTLQIWGAGRTGRRWARALLEAGYVVDSFVDAHADRWGQYVCGAQVQPPQAARRGGAFILAATGTPGAREEIEVTLRQSGLQPWRDYLAVA